MSQIDISYTKAEHPQDERNRVGPLADILVASAPILILGLIGEWLGDNTLAGAILINIAYLLTIGITTIILHRRGSGWLKIGLARPQSWSRTILLALGAVVVSVLAYFASQAIIQFLPGTEVAPADKSNYDAISGNLLLLAVYLAAAWTIVPFGEEMFFRAFLIDRLAAIFPQARNRWAFALIGSALLFGLAHYSWGPGGIVETAVFGLVWAFIYLRSGRNLWVTMICHSLLNSLSFLVIFLSAGA